MIVTIKSARRTMLRITMMMLLFGCAHSANEDTDSGSKEGCRGCSRAVDRLRREIGKIGSACGDMAGNVWNMLVGKGNKTNKGRRQSGLRLFNPITGIMLLCFMVKPADAFWYEKKAGAEYDMQEFVINPDLTIRAGFDPTKHPSCTPRSDDKILGEMKALVRSLREIRDGASSDPTKVLRKKRKLKCWTFEAINSDGTTDELGASPTPAQPPAPDAAVPVIFEWEPTAAESAALKDAEDRWKDIHDVAKRINISKLGNGAAESDFNRHILHRWGKYLLRLAGCGGPHHADIRFDPSVIELLQKLD